MFARTAQLPMMAIFGLPLALIAVHRFVDAPSRWTAAGIAGALWLQALACGYYTVFALLVVGLGLLYFAVQGARWRSAQYQYVLTSTAHWQHLVDGYGAFWPADLLQLATDTEDFPSPSAFERIRG
jgi:hypothetical protein